jgi:hypothetical protein
MKKISTLNEQAKETILVSAIMAMIVVVCLVF